MREKFMEQLIKLHNELTSMGYMCQKAIALAMEGLLDGKKDSCHKAIVLAKETDEAEKNVENLCLKMILQQQPVAGDLRTVSAALKMISDLERIGDQAADIAELSLYIEEGDSQSLLHIGDMAEAAVKMVTDSVEAFVKNDLELARKVIDDDDKVDGLFNHVKDELRSMIDGHNIETQSALDLLMAAKYLEKIGDHAVNLAEWVVYSITGQRENNEHQPGNNTER